MQTERDEMVERLILVSDIAYSAAGLNLGELEIRHLELKGKSQPILVHALSVVT